LRIINNAFGGRYNPGGKSEIGEDGGIQHWIKKLFLEEKINQLRYKYTILRAVWQTELYTHEQKNMICAFC